MKRIRGFCFLVLLVVAALNAGAQGIALRIDSIIEKGTAHFNHEVPIADNDSVEIRVQVVNQTGSYIQLDQSDLRFACTYKGIRIDSTNFYWQAVPETLANGDSAELKFLIGNTSNRPLPNLSPGGGSVVIWPILLYQPLLPDSVEFTLIYSIPGNNENGELLYTHNKLRMIFPTQEERFYELYDITGRRVFSVEASDLVTDFNLETFTTGVYVLRVRQGTDSRAFKFSKY